MEKSQAVASSSSSPHTSCASAVTFPHPRNQDNHFIRDLKELRNVGAL